MLPIKFGIVGGFQAGKSTLINCLLGENVATVGDGRSTTHTIVNYLFSKNEHIEIEYIWGDSESFKLENSEKIPDNTSSILDEAIRYTPKIQFGVVSTQNNWGVSKDVNFDAYISNWVVLKGCDFFEGDEFKIRANNDWNINYGMPDTQEFGGIKEGVKYTLVLNGKNIIAPVDDSYYIYFNVATKELCVMREGTIPIVKAINVYLDNQFLRNFSLVDMPGYGFNEEDNRLAECAISLIDYAIVVMTNHKAIGGEDSKLFSVIQLLKQRKVPYYFCVNCTDENKYKWSPDNRLNVDIYNESVFHLNSYLPLACPDDDVIPIVNFMWYWYSQYPEDPIFEEYKNLLFAYDLLDNNRSLKEIERYSNFHLIEKIFSMENRMYLELKKEIKEELQKLKDEVCPIGTIQAFAFNRIPDGWMICDGQWLQVLDYPELFGAIGHTFGKVDENSFKIPDLRGRFVRGWSKDGEIDKGRKLGSLQEDSLQGHSHYLNVSRDYTESSGSHTHDFYTKWFEVNGWGNTGVNYINNGYTSDSKYDKKKVCSDGGHSHKLPEITIGAAKDSRVASETRPINVALLYCIKVGFHSEATSFATPNGDIVENAYGDIDWDNDYDVDDSPISEELSYKDIINKL